MTLHQGAAFAILGIMLVLFASDRLRYDLVAGLGLIAAALTGIVPADKAFDGFSNPVIIIIGSVLMLSRAIAISSDFLPPIGHQNKALVMSPGDYRFGDYWRLGLPLSVIVASMGTWLIPIFWPPR